ncbi:MAG TPA: PAS domain-containing protein, partial [Methanomicrobiales archaeon]|nr:PAS domain-containing protein [Methanomicrobiales archaeon]
MAVSSNPSRDPRHQPPGEEKENYSSAEVERIVQERVSALERENVALHHKIASLEQLDAEREKAEEELRESEERLRAVFDHSLDAIYRRNLQTGRYDYMSPAIEQIIGFAAEELNAMSVEERIDHVHHDDRSSVESKIVHAATQGKGSLEYRFRAKDGHYRWVSDHFSITLDVNGDPLYRSGVVRDVTESKRAEEALKDREFQLRLALENAGAGMWIRYQDGSW